MRKLGNRFAQGMIAFAAILLVAQATMAQVSVVGVDSIHFEWEPAAGNPDGYRVSVSWSGAPPVRYKVVPVPAVTIAVAPGDRVAIQVEALRVRPEGGFDIGPASELSTEVIVEAALFEDAGFDSDTDGFSFADDAFRGTAAGAYSNGVHSSQGGYTGGGLRIDLGGVDDDDVSGISGAWSTQIYLSTAKVVTIKVRTRITTSGFFESDECIESLLAIDGVVIGSSGEEYLLRACGTTPEAGTPSDTGWVQRTITLWLSSGAHTIELGGYASKKTSVIETAAVHFDDVSVTTPTTSSETLSAQPESVSFGSILQGATTVLTRLVVVDVSGTSPRTFSVSSNQPWASATPVSNTTPATMRVEVDPSALAFGANVATLTLSGAGVTTRTIPVSVVVVAAGVFAATFENNVDGFAYADDRFRATSEPGYASGSLSSNGGYTGGALRIDLGGVDANTVVGMSGGFSRNFTIPIAADYAIRVRTRMVFSGEYEDDECSQVLIAVDGILHGYDSDDFLTELCGEANPLNGPQDTSWYDETLIVPLDVGTHVLTIGGYNNKKTLDNEYTQIFVDDVVVENAASLPEPGVGIGVASGVVLVGLLGRLRSRRRGARP